MKNLGFNFSTSPAVSDQNKRTRNYSVLYFTLQINRSNLFGNLF